jgi:flavoprotein family protein
MRVGIIGGGAAGMMAAVNIKLLNNNIDVTIHEKNQRPGKKLLATGNGKCNYTNSDIDVKYYHTKNENLKKILQDFDFEKCIEFFKSIGIEPINKNSYIYPMSEQASSILNALELKIRELSVKVISESNIVDIEYSKCIKLKSKDKSYTYDSVLISCGGLAGLELNYNDSLYPVLKKQTYKIVKPLSALCPVVPFEIKRLKKTEGVRVKSKVALYINDSLYSTEFGELQFSKNYLSGIVIFQLSRHISRALDEGQKVELGIDFLPSVHDKLDFFTKRHKILKNYTWKDFGNGLINNKLWEELLSELKLDMNALVKVQEIKKIVSKVSDCKYLIKESAGFLRAQVSTGGVALSDVNLKTMESSFQKNIYFAGEVLDVDGICGGYNLHWAWASGYLAAKSISG